MKIPTNRWRDLFYICIADFQCNHSASVQGKGKNTPVQTKSHYSLAQIKTPNPCTHTHVNVHLPCFVYKSSCTMEWKNLQYIYSTWEKKKIDNLEQDRKRKKRYLFAFQCNPQSSKSYIWTRFLNNTSNSNAKTGVFGALNVRSVNALLILLLHSAVFCLGVFNVNNLTALYRGFNSRSLLLEQIKTKTFKPFVGKVKCRYFEFR